MNRFTRVTLRSYDGLAGNALLSDRETARVKTALEFKAATRKDTTKRLVKYDTIRGARSPNTRDRSRRVLSGAYLIFGTRLRPVSVPQFSRLRPLQLHPCSENGHVRSGIYGFCQFRSL